jgi:hypothetical protein
VGEQRRRVRRQLVRRHRGDDDQVDVGGARVGVGERAAGGRERQVGRALAGRGVAALADPRAADDPVGVDADALGDLRVADHAVGELVAEADDPRGAQRGPAGQCVLLGGQRVRH